MTDLGRTLCRHLVILFFLAGISDVGRADLLLWNKLGSETEVQSSEFGPDFTIPSGASLAYQTVKFDGGIEATAEDTVSKIYVPTDLLFPGAKDKGTVEFWARFLVSSDDPDNFIGYVVGNQKHSYPYYTTILLGFTPNIYVQYGDAHVTMQSSAPPWTDAGDVIHVAVCWDKEGIDGGGDIARMYVDGELAVASTTPATWDQAPEDNFYVLAHTGAPYLSYQNIVIDNIKIYDHAKTDFSDRFNESPVPQPEIDVAPLSLDFGDVVLPGSNAFIVTISNVGTAALGLESVELGSSSSPHFAITAAPVLPSSLPPGASEDVEITFSPTLLGDSTAELEIRSNDSDEALVTVQLSGAGVPSEEPPAEQIAVTLEFVEASVAEGTLEGSGAGTSGPRRLSALVNQIEAAGDLVDLGMIDDACGQLRSSLRRTDGVFPPPDFVEGDAAEMLALLIEITRTSLSCN